MKKIFLIILILGIFFISGCTQITPNAEKIVVSETGSGETNKIKYWEQMGKLQA